MSGDGDTGQILAAGAVVWRPDDRGGIEVAVVHRPRYDDWSLPKGKLDPGETIPATAVREVAEETGFRAVLGRRLTTIHYDVPGRDGRRVPKTVEYFSAKAVGGAFEPSAEVDELRWLDPDQAQYLCTRDSDSEVLSDFRALPPELTTVLLVRHGKAGKREEWNGDDDLRPLAAAGMRQAEALRAMMPAFGPDRVFSAPRLRCVQTVQGIGEDLDVEVRQERLLSEEGYLADPVVGLARLLAIVTDDGVPVICSQGGVIPHAVSTLAERDGVALPRTKKDTVPCKKGSVWVLSFQGATENAGPKLVSADYYPTALPIPAPSRL
jgi:8-oxo-dGTP pyrophosphatase MutT (NUDIX family)/phosphohistidine phosphatase SixA